MTDGALLVFTRPPVAGQTKTRLVPLLGEAGASALHRRMLWKTLTVAKQSRFGVIELWCSDTFDDPFLQTCGRAFALDLRPQQGRDLGDKMCHAINVTLAVYDFVVVIGSDCPSLAVDHLNQAHRYLSSGQDAVLGPATDGGYYLIGLRAPAADLFRNIAWGGEDVARETRRRFERCGLDYAELAPLTDIDTPEDYRRYAIAGGTIPTLKMP